jgi:hypothetical protein
MLKSFAAAPEFSCSDSCAENDFSRDWKIKKSFQSAGTQSAILDIMQK